MKEDGDYKWSTICSSLNIKKQSYYQMIKRQSIFNDQLEDLFLRVDLIREDHPGMGIRDIYWLIKPLWIGRDRFEATLQMFGYGVSRPVSYFKTTKAGGRWKEFSNLINGVVLNGINQLWVTDITYYMVNGSFCYIFLIMDVYSRRVLGFGAWKNMYATMAYEVLKMALKKRGIKEYGNNLIHH